MHTLVAMSDSELAAKVGGKAHGLVRLIRIIHERKATFHVPPFFVVSADTDYETDKHSFAARIADALAQISPDGVQNSSYAVRSSCLCEDQINGSFAGQYDSFLGVEAKNVFARIEQVVAARTKTGATQYTNLLHINPARTEMAVLVQLMVSPQAAGVAFSLDPVKSGIEAKETVVISAVSGLADKLVQGTEDGEHITVHADKITRCGATPISNAAILTLASQTKLLESICGFPVDIEWAVRDGQLNILQVRPITTTSQAISQDNCDDDQARMLRIFDGSNIQESYPGITTPMTFSFIRRAYKDVYHSFVKLMGVSDVTIAANEDIFSSMLGYIDGRVYYNLGSWYRLLALLPAYKTNREFMEKMMGLKEPALAVRPETTTHTAANLKAKLATTLALLHIGREYLNLAKSRKNFDERLAKLINIDRGALKKLDMNSLCKLYRSLEIDLLTKWDAPIVNDFFAMIFFGVYQKLNGDSTTYHDLIEGLGNIVSAEPPKLIREIASLIKDDRALLAAIRQNPRAPYVEQLFRSHPRAFALYVQYLDKFGDRSIGELKLESASVRENPSLLLATIAAVAGSMAANLQGEGTNDPGSGEGDRRISSNVNSKDARFQTKVLSKLLLPFVSARTRDLIAGRENLRFARTRIFGLVRDIILNLADRLVDEGVLDGRQDVFYLEIEEVLGFVEGNSTCKNLRALAAVRRADECTYAESGEDRIYCRGAVGLRKRSGAFEAPARSVIAVKTGSATGKSATTDAPGTADGRLKGLPACAGKFVGRARVISDPATEHLMPGEILIAERTDPGWIMHFAVCRAIVTSYGSMLSHTAIVARELKIPAVVSAKGATEKIATGDLIEVDGAAGLVTILEKAAPEVVERKAS